MMPSGHSTPIGGAQSVSASLLRSNSGMLGHQGGGLTSPAGFASLISPRTQFKNVNMLGNMQNPPSILNQSFGNDSHNQESVHGSNERGGNDSGAEADTLSGVGTGMGFNAPSAFLQSSMVEPASSGQVQGQQFSHSSGNHQDQPQPQHLEPQNFQHGLQAIPQFNSPQLAREAAQQQQFQAIRAGLAGGGVPIKMEPQVSSDQIGQQQQQQLQSLRNLQQVKVESLPPVKLEPQQIPTMRNLASVKTEPKHSDHSVFLHQQQQQQQQQSQHLQQQLQQQFPHISRQPSQVAAAQINLLHQQKVFQMQQQQQLLNAMPQQRPQLQQQFQQQNLPSRSPMKPGYEPGMCARRLTHYMYQQQHRPEDNSIEFWRKFVAEYFAPNARKKWCVSMYGTGRQTTGVFPQDVWHCEICNRKPGRGFEATAEVLPRLFKIKYESGTLEELLYVDMPREYHNSSGQIVLDYAKAIQESVFEQLRVVRDGQLRIVFAPDLKICSWEFCARRHEELIPRRLLIPQVSQLGAATQKYQAATQNASSNLSAPELQNNCNLFVASARQLAKALEVPLVNDLGYTKRYIRCLQISEVVNSMKDLIDYSRETGIGPMESLAKFPRRTGTSAVIHSQDQQSEEQRQMQYPQSAQRSSSDQSAPARDSQMAANSGLVGVKNNSLNTAATSTSSSTIAGILHQNSMNSRPQNSLNNGSPYPVQIPSPGSCNTVPQAQSNPHPFQSPMASMSNGTPQAHQSALVPASHLTYANSLGNLPVQQSALSGEVELSDSQSSVQKILREMIIPNQLNGASGMIGAGSMGNDMKNINGMLSTGNNTLLNGGSSFVGSGVMNNASGIGSAGFGTMNGGLGHAAMVNGMRAAMGNIPVMNGRVNMTAMSQNQGMNHQHDLGNQILSGIGAVNGFNNLQFDWRPSP